MIKAFFCVDTVGCLSTFLLLTQVVFWNEFFEILLVNYEKLFQLYRRGRKK